MTAINIKAYTNDNTQIEVIKAVLSAFKIKFEIGIDKPYNDEFVAKILESKEQVKNGKVTRVKKEELDNFLGL
jgi:hypothetical protein